MPPERHRDLLVSARRTTIVRCRKGDPRWWQSLGSRSHGPAAQPRCRPQVPREHHRRVLPRRRCRGVLHPRECPCGRDQRRRRSRRRTGAVARPTPQQHPSRAAQLPWSGGRGRSGSTWTRRSETTGRWTAQSWWTSPNRFRWRTPPSTWSSPTSPSSTCRTRHTWPARSTGYSGPEGGCAPVHPTSTDSSDWVPAPCRTRPTPPGSGDSSPPGRQRTSSRCVYGMNTRADLRAALPGACFPHHRLRAVR